MVRAGSCACLVLCTLCACGGGSKASSTTAAPIFGPGAQSFNVNWTDNEPLTTGGRLVYRTKKIEIEGDAYRVTASILNRTGQEIQTETFDAAPHPEYMVERESLGLAYREEPPGGRIANRKMINTRAAWFDPPLPASIPPGGAWTGTFSGKSRDLTKHSEWWVTYGYFSPGGYWLTDKTITTRVK